MPGWDGHPVAERLRERFGAPVVLERDVNAMAVGEHRRHWPRCATCCSSRSRPGSAPGIITDGQLLRGLHGRAGDIGHIRAITRLGRALHVRQPWLRRRARVRLGHRPPAPGGRRRGHLDGRCGGARGRGTGGVAPRPRGRAGARRRARRRRRDRRADRPGGRRRAGGGVSSRCWRASASRSTSGRRRWRRASCAP